MACFVFFPDKVHGNGWTVLPQASCQWFPNKCMDKLKHVFSASIVSYMAVLILGSQKVCSNESWYDCNLPLVQDIACVWRCWRKGTSMEAV